MSNLLTQVKAARRVSTPLIGITTPDPAATVTAICEGLPTDGEDLGEAVKIEWDLVRGMSPRCLSGDAAREAIAAAGEVDPTPFSPVALLTFIEKLPARSIVFMHLAHRMVSGESGAGVVQAILNLRDRFKLDRRMLILLGPALPLPAELAGDVLVFDEPLPDAAALAKIVRDIHTPVNLAIDDAGVAKAVEAITGLAAFPAEQVTAMSLKRDGLDIEALWERKRQQIEQTPGLKVFRKAERFEDIGGVPIVKSFLQRIMTGHARPNAIVFIDEIEKMIGGARGDSSGVSQDQLGSLLAYMQDHAAAGMIFIGPPGAAKSAIAKAAGTCAGIPTIQLDLGAAKGSLVGQSEQTIRTALKVITSVSNNCSLWIATCNSITDLPPELRRRFTLGTFFFDLPDAAERKAIWDIYVAKYGLKKPAGNNFNDEGWTGAEIKQCCDIAWRLGCTIPDAAAFVVPVSKSAADSIEGLRKQAEGRFLSASVPGVYRRGGVLKVADEKPGKKAREMQLAD